MVMVVMEGMMVMMVGGRRAPAGVGLTVARAAQRARFFARALFSRARFGGGAAPKRQGGRSQIEPRPQPNQSHHVQKKQGAGTIKPRPNSSIKLIMSAPEPAV